MKKILFLLPFFLFAFACNKSVDKKKQLDDLKKQEADLGSKIDALQKEVGASDTTAKREKVNFVGVTPVVVQSFNHYIELQGAVVADDEVFITSKIPGSITSVNIKVGDQVKAGQIVFEIDDALLRQQMDEIQNRLDLATDLYNKQKSLWDQKIGSEVQFITAKNSMDAAQKNMATMKRSLEMYHVAAPISGIVDEMPTKIGQATSPGAQLAKIVNFSKLKVRAEVAEAFAGKVRQGNACKVVFPDIKKEIDSRISYVGNSINTLNRTFKVEVSMRPNEAGLIPNMLSIIRVADYSNPKAVVAPINVVQKDAEGDYVLLADVSGGRARKARVKVGSLFADQAEILSGLRVGDKLITTGYQDVNDGDAIKF